MKSELRHFGGRDVRLVCQSHQHLGLHQLDLLFDYLSPFCKACIVQDITLEQLPYRSILQPRGARAALVEFVFLTLIQRLLAAKLVRVKLFDFVHWDPDISRDLFRTQDLRLEGPMAAYPLEMVDLPTGMERVLADEKPPKAEKDEVVGAAEAYLGVNRQGATPPQV